MLSFSWGTCIGSFLNVCIYRIPLDKSVVAPRSYCPNCKKNIPWYYNIPLFSYLLLRGKCKYCKKPISVRYWLVELLVAVLFFLVWLKFDHLSGNSPFGLVTISDWKLIPAYWLIIIGLTLGSFVDFEHMIIPDRVTLGGIVCGLILSTLIPSLHGQESMMQGLIMSGIGLVAGWGSLWSIAIIGKFVFKKEAMGFGDVKLLGAIGAFLGWQAVIFTIAFSSLFGSLIGIILIFAGKKETQSRIPYGPYLALAALLWMLWGSAWWQAYLNYTFGGH
ncbi:prepilin peptidase [PVC group bacterium]|nr:prepilin peptidase [PVC group bacterium]